MTQIRSKEAIEADIAAARDHLAETVEGLFVQLHPRAIVHNAVADARALGSAQVKAARAELVNPDGSVRVERMALIGAAVAGSIAFVAVVRSLLRR
jgi:Protein of unknown function (DUF3618).